MTLFHACADWAAAYLIVVAVTLAFGLAAGVLAQAVESICNRVARRDDRLIVCDENGRWRSITRRERDREARHA